MWNVKQKMYCTITIDTEPDCTTKWTRSNPLTFESIEKWIPELLTPLFDKYNVKPVYFVSPEPLYFDKPTKVLKDLVEHWKCEIWNHLHSEYIEPEKKWEKFDWTDSNAYLCFDYSDEIEFGKLKNYHNFIKERLWVEPVSYRAARYWADINTIRSLKKLWYKVDSSVTPWIDWSKQWGPNFKNFSNQPYWVDENNFSKDSDKKEILEVPISIWWKRFPFLPDKWLFYKWLRPTHMTVFEQKNLIKEIIKENKNKEIVVLNIMFHSMEIIPNATPFVRSKLEQKLYLNRLEWIIKYIQKIWWEFKTLEEIYNLYKYL